MDDRLRVIEERLRAGRLHAAADRISAVRRELALVRKPPNWFEAMPARARALVRRSFDRFRVEIQETGDLLDLLYKRASGQIDAFSEDEYRRVREQLYDILKTVPSSAILAGLMFVPVPGAQLLSPLLLRRLGLLPSAWREARLVAMLGDTAAWLRAEGRTAEADELDALLAEVRPELERDAKRFEEMVAQDVAGSRGKGGGGRDGGG